MKKLVSLLLVLSLFLFSLLSLFSIFSSSSVLLVSAQQTGCCINDQTGFPITTKDLSCNNVLQSDCPGGSTFVTGSSCNLVQECGACVANPTSANHQFYTGGDFITTANFCRDFFSGANTTIISGMTTNEILQLQQSSVGGSVATTIPTTVSFGNITGNIKSGGVNMPGLNVKIILSANQLNIFSTITDNQGNFRFNNVQQGAYQLFSQGCGFNNLNQNIVNTQNLDNFNLNINRAQKENVVIDTLDSNNNLLGGVTFRTSPQTYQVADSVNGKTNINNIDSNCEYNVTATYNGVILTKSISVRSDDSVIINPLTFNFPAVSDECKTTSDCRGPDGILGEGVDCTQFCQGRDICDGGNGLCVSSTQTNCCSYEFQCPSTSIVQGSNVCATGKTECGQSCSNVPICPENTKLSIGSAGPICECTAPVLIGTGLNYPYQPGEGKYCCNGVLSDNQCEYKTDVRVYGQVIGNAGPLVAEIIIDKNTVNEKRAFTDISGDYELFLSPNVQHTLEYRKGKSYDPQIKNIQKSAGAQEKIDIILSSSGGRCDSPNSPPVIDFFADNVRGEPSALLKWTPPNCGSSSKPQTYMISESSLGNFTVAGSESELLFGGLDWAEEYGFSIIVVYSDKSDLRYSDKKELFQPFDPGVVGCSGRNNGDEFCIDLTKRRVCDAQNQISSAVNIGRGYTTDDCSAYDSPNSPGEWYCSYDEDNNGETKCLQQSEQLCGYQINSTGARLPINIPFLGLLFNEDSCSYDNTRKQYSKGCYLDKSDTTVDFCFSCPKPEDPEFTCAQYQSESSCDTNQCGIPSECVWEYNKFEALGKGSCYAKETLEEKKKTQIDTSGIQTLLSQTSCDACSSSSGLFNNLDCTQNVCSTLGLCYETSQTSVSPSSSQSSCTQCALNPKTGLSLTTCNDFKTESSCINATGDYQAFFENSNGDLIYSDDACGIGKCVWDQAQNFCFKDGNLDNVPDCTSSSTGGLNHQCAQDYISPVSTPLSHNVILNRDPNSLSNNLEFSISESITKFNFCMYKSGTPECTNFESLSGGRTIRSGTSYKLTFNPLTTLYNIVNESGVYHLRYYAEDHSSNKEQTKSIPLVFDSENPTISFDYNIECNNCDKVIDCKRGESYDSKITFNILSDESVSCRDYLILPGYSKINTPYNAQFNIDNNGNKIHELGSELLDGSYRYIVECVDRAGNKQIVEEVIDVESSKLINSVSPRGSLSSLDVNYSVETITSSSCILSVDGNQAIKLGTNDNLNHQKTLTYSPDRYHYYTIFCNENNPIVESRCDASLQEFIVDTSPPVTKAKINSRIFSSTWVTSSSTFTELILVPEDVGTNGLSFGTDYTKVCITQGTTCNPDTDPQSETYHNGEEIRIRVINNLGVCYYSVDNGGNKESLKCGKVNLVPPPEITITSPIDNFVTDQFSINLVGTHKIANVTSAQITVSNGTDEEILSSPNFPLSLFNTPFNIPVQLLDGENTISLIMVDGSNVAGEDIITVYKDNQGPEISSISPTYLNSINYGDNFTVSATIKDTKWTAVSSGNNIGEVKNAKIILQSIPLNFTEEMNLINSGNSWTSQIIPQLSGRYYNILPGDYDLFFHSEDKFGNPTLLKSNLTIIKSTPTSATLNLSDYNHREKNIFYTNKISQDMSVVTEEPSECTILLSQNPLIEENFNTTDNYNHTLISGVTFNKGSKQIFSSIILCKDTLSNLDKIIPIEIVYDDSLPEIILSSSRGILEIEKKDRVYELLEKDTILSAKSLSGEEISCDINCWKKDSFDCGAGHSNLISQFGSKNYVLLQEGYVDYSIENNPYGVYRYEFSCKDKFGNMGTPKDILLSIESESYEIVDRNELLTNSQTPELYVKTNFPSEECTIGGGNIGNKKDMVAPISSHPRFSESGQLFLYQLSTPLTPSSKQRFDVECTRFGSTQKVSTILEAEYTPNPISPTINPISPRAPLPDLETPIISDVKILNSLGKIGIIENERKDYFKKVTLVNGALNNQFSFKLIVDTQEQVECKYGTSPSNFATLPSTMIQSQNSYYQETPLLSLVDKSSQKYFISCADISGKESKLYEVEVNADSESPIEIMNPHPQGHISSSGVVVNALTYRDLDCSYNDGRNNKKLVKKLTDGGYIHTSSTLPGQFIQPAQNIEHSFEITCKEKGGGGFGIGGLSASKQINFTIDTQPPILTITSHNSDTQTNHGYLDIEGVTEPGVKINTYVNGFFQNSFNVGGNKSLTTLNFNTRVYLENEGLNKLIIEAEDLAGNKRNTKLNVDSSSKSPRVLSTYPYHDKLSSLDVVSARLSSFTTSGEINVIDSFGNSVQGSIQYSSQTQELIFTPISKFVQGSYSFEVIPRDPSGNPGFGSYGRFNISPEVPSIRWISPLSLDSNVNKEGKIEIKSNSQNRDRLITDVKLYAGLDLDNLREYKMERFANSYLSTSQLPQGKQYVKLVFSDIGGSSETIRIIDVDTKGPNAQFTPSGTIGTTRPIIIADFGELVNIKSFSLTNIPNGEQNTLQINTPTTQNNKFEFVLGAQLLKGSYNFTIEVEDIKGNSQTSSHIFTVSVGNSINLQIATPQSGVSPTNIFDLVFETNQDAECRYSNLDVGGNFNSHSGTFSTTGRDEHIIRGFSDIKTNYPDTQSIYVVCKSPFSTTTPSTKYDLSIDTSPPKFENVNVVPKVVTERPLSTQIVVDTDKETICKFDCMGNLDYDSMQNSLGNSFSKTHLVNFQVKDKTKYECNVACQSKSGLVTSPQKINFEADTSILPPFDILSPMDGSAFSNKTVPLHIISERLARCSYKINNESVVNFPQVSREFKGTISNLTVSSHILEVECLFSAGSEKKTSNFVIDLTPPTNVSVSHPGSVCSASSLNMEFNSQDEESGIEGYLYSVKESTGNVIVNETFTNNNKITKLSQLSNGNSYIFTVRAKNNAGLETLDVDSTSLSISNSSLSCYDKISPTVNLIQNKTGGKTFVTLKCTDSGSGCSSNQRYGISLTSLGCNATSVYTSQLEITQESYVCYSVTDNAGNIASDSEKINVLGSLPGIDKLKVDVGMERKDNLTFVTLSCINSNCTSIKYGLGNDYSSCVPDREYSLPIEVSEDGTYICYLAIGESGEKIESAQKVLVRQAVIPTKSFPWIYLIIIGISVVLIGVGGYFGYNYMQNKPSKIVSSERGISPTKELISDKKSKLPKKTELVGDGIKTKESTHNPLRDEKLKQRQKVRDNLFDSFIDEKEKIIKQSKRRTDPPKKAVEIGFDDLDKLVSSSNKFDKLINKFEKPIKKNEFSELQKLSSEKGVKVTKDEFFDLMKLVNEKIKKKEK